VALFNRPARQGLLYEFYTPKSDHFFRWILIYPGG